MNKILIFGITGQIGSYLAEFYLNKGYEVHGVIRRSSSFNTGRIDHLYRDPHLDNVRLFLHFGDLSDTGTINRVIDDVRPEIIINCGAQSHVRVSFDIPEYTFDITGGGVVRILEAIRNIDKNIRFLQYSSSECFGDSPAPQNESTEFRPRSPYAIAKLAGYWITRNYREAYNIFASNIIQFNCESVNRGETFVTRKITLGLADILSGKKKKIYLGNIEARRDWLYIDDAVKAADLIINHSRPDNFVIGSGKSYSIRDFLSKAFSYKGLDYKEYIGIDRRYFRPTEVNHLCANYSKAIAILCWQPEVDFDALVKMMVDHDCEKTK